MTANLRHDAPLVIVGRADRNPDRAWSRPLTIADELGPRQPIPQAEPVDETWQNVLVGLFVVLLLVFGGYLWLVIASAPRIGGAA